MDELSFKETDLKFYFVVDDGIEDINDVSSDMNIAFSNIKEYFPDESVQWIPKKGCLKFTGVQLTKRHIFILDEFSGDAFDYLQQSKSLIVGPRCLITCLAENASIPLGISPVFTTAMRNLVISASGFSVPEKEKIQSLVSWMGGYYMDNLSLSCTHLVSNTVKSNKYEQAALNAIPIMHSDWVYTVWERNKSETISATSREFEKHRLPIFYNLNITSTGLTGDRKNKVMNLVNEFGGTYQKSFKSSVTDILITEKNKTDSDKYQVAVKYKKDCLLPDWIFDSVTKGYALPTKYYKVARMKISTPTKSERSISISDFNPDGTQLSEISHIASGRANCTINETCLSTPAFNSTGTQQVVKSGINKSSQKAYKALIEQINPAQAKKAGLFLDGCCIYLSGFTVAEREKLNKILNTGGATRFDEICDKLTHIIVGELIPADFNALKINAISVPILNLEWLIESIKQKHPVEERVFIYSAKLPICVEPEIASPSSKKTLQSMNHSFKKPVAAAPMRRQLFGSDSNPPQVEDPKEKDLLQQYLDQQRTSLPPIPGGPSTSAVTPRPSSAASSEPDSQFSADDFVSLDFFTGKTVYIHEHYDGLLAELVKDCEKAGAKLVNEKYRGKVDYVIVPSNASTDVESIPVKGKHIVNSLWLDDAMAENRLLEEEYFYAPISKNADFKPLVGLQVVISLYSGNERTFIESLANVLGATCNDVYAKKERPLLICKSPEGAKYSAAIKWGYPAVTSQWLIECSTEGRRIEMDPYLVGDAVAEGRFFLDRTRKTSSESSGSDDKSGANCKEIRSENNSDITRRADSDVTLRHPRVSELINRPDRRSYNSDIETTPTSPAGALNVSDFVKEFSTPLRETLYNIIKEDKAKEQLATPGSKLKTPPTPKIPDFCTTPEYRKRMLAFYDKYYIPTDNKKRRESTPVSDLKRRMWREALGDDYVEEFTYTQINTQTQAETPGAVDVFAGSLTSDSGGLEQNMQSSNLKRLSDFIKQREESRGQSPLPALEPDIMPSRVPESQALPATAEEKDDMIGWRDPSEFMPRKRSKMDAQLFKGTPRFSISCSSDKETIIKQIKALNGELCDNLSSFDAKCTHIVCERPNRGEKILSCIASGKWILSVKYIDDSVNAGYFLNEEDYEFGNPKATSLPKLENTEKTIASAAFRWRTKVASDPTKASGVFTGFRVILHVLKKDQFHTVITAGGGVVLKVQPPYAKSEEALDATHCFVENKKIQLTPSDHKALAEAGVRVLTALYLNAYLTSDVEPDYTNYLMHP